MRFDAATIAALDDVDELDGGLAGWAKIRDALKPKVPSKEGIKGAAVGAVQGFVVSGFNPIGAAVGAGVGAAQAELAKDKAKRDAPKIAEAQRLQAEIDAKNAAAFEALTQAAANNYAAPVAVAIPARTPETFSVDAGGALVPAGSTAVATTPTAAPAATDTHRLLIVGGCVGAGLLLLLVLK